MFVQRNVALGSAMTASVISLLMVFAAVLDRPAPLEISMASIAATAVLWFWVIAQAEYEATLRGLARRSERRKEALADLAELRNLTDN
jgi:hypothetical protein